MCYRNVFSYNEQLGIARSFRTLRYIEGFFDTVLQDDITLKIEHFVELENKDRKVSMMIPCAQVNNDTWSLT